jgi:hypothetical protein
VSLAIARRSLKTCVVVLSSSIGHVQILVLHGLRPVPDQFIHAAQPKDVLLLDVICRRRGIKWLSLVPVRWFFRVFGDCKVRLSPKSSGSSLLRLMWVCNVDSSCAQSQFFLRQPFSHRGHNLLQVRFDPQSNQCTRTLYHSSKSSLASELQSFVRCWGLRQEATTHTWHCCCPATDIETGVRQVRQGFQPSRLQQRTRVPGKASLPDSAPLRSIASRTRGDAAQNGRRSDGPNERTALERSSHDR